MFYVVISLYFLFLRFVWGFFIVARIHAYKFKNFSYNIEKITNFVTMILVILTILWFLIIFNFNEKSFVKIDETKETDVNFIY